MLHHFCFLHVSSSIRLGGRRALSDEPSGGFLRDPTFQKLLYLDVAANVVADISEDWEESTRNRRDLSVKETRYGF
jgi:hypothetical protein